MKAEVYCFTNHKIIEPEQAFIEPMNAAIKPDGHYPFNLRKKVAETAKAYGFYYFIVEYVPTEDVCYFAKNVHWLPKSQMYNALAPGWVLIAKANDIFKKIIQEDPNLLDKACDGRYDLDNLFIYFNGYKIMMSESDVSL